MSIVLKPEAQEIIAKICVRAALRAERRKQQEAAMQRES